MGTIDSERLPRVTDLNPAYLLQLDDRYWQHTGNSGAANELGYDLRVARDAADWERITGEVALIAVDERDELRIAVLDTMIDTTLD